MIDTAGFQDCDKLLSGLIGTGAGAAPNARNQADIAKQIEQVLAPSFGGGGDSLVDSLIASCTSGGASGDSVLDSLIGSYSSGASSNDPVLNSIIASYQASLSADASFDVGGASGGGGASAAPYSGGSGGGKPVANYFMTHLQKDFGLTKNQAAGIVANLWYESGGMNPNMNRHARRGADVEHGTRLRGSAVDRFAQTGVPRFRCAQPYETGERGGKLRVSQTRVANFACGCDSCGETHRQRSSRNDGVLQRVRASRRACDGPTICSTWTSAARWFGYGLMRRRRYAAGAFTSFSATCFFQ